MTRENPPDLELKITLSYNVVIWMFYLVFRLANFIKNFLDNFKCLIF